MQNSDDSSIITDLHVSSTGSLSSIREAVRSPPKEISDLKRAQLTSARAAAVVSRKKKQATNLETRLHEVRSILGEVSHGQADRIFDVLQAQELHTRQEQKKLVQYFINLLEKMSKFSALHFEREAAAAASVKRSVERLRLEVSELNKLMFSGRQCIPLSEVSSTSSAFKR